MNLVDQKILFERDDNSDSILNFRKNQMDLIPELLLSCINFISKQNVDYNIKISNIILREPIQYNFHPMELLEYSVVVSTSKKESEYVYFTLYVPKLIYGEYFLLGSYYCPTMYILDKPISIKKSSYKFYTLFNPITLMNRKNDKTIIFSGVNFSSSQFLTLCFYNHSAELNEIIDKLDLDKSQIDAVLSFFRNKFRFKRTDGVDEIYEKINNLFLDDYSAELYKACYNLEKVGLREILYHGIIHLTKKEFIDLTDKRLIFIELLLSPLFKRIAKTATSTLRGFIHEHIVLDKKLVVSHFLNDLHGNYLYNCVNLINTIGSKCAFISPSSENAPTSVSLLHWTHFGRICPSSVSSQRPGETVMLTPDVRVDKFGQFL